MLDTEYTPATKFAVELHHPVDGTTEHRIVVLERDVQFGAWSVRDIIAFDRDKVKPLEDTFRALIIGEKDEIDGITLMMGDHRVEYGGNGDSYDLTFRMNKAQGAIALLRATLSIGS